MYGYYGYSLDYFIYVLPALLLAMYAQYKISSAYGKYSKIDSNTGINGAEAAKIIMDRNDLSDVVIKMIPGKLSDNYNPQTRELNLSKEVYQGTSIASLAISAHEVGHAIQHQRGYKPLVLRSLLVPAASAGSNIAMLFIFAGLFFSSFFLKIGIALFSLAVLFQIVTLPVEFNASKRAQEQLAMGILSEEQLKGSRSVLSAAALTYVASTLVAIGQLLRL
ncbi:MAG: zinc metallopeptidase, partial [Peptoniphilus sp.]|nr:zinc metallopeptidase [Peptoniphilus sp.]